MFRTTLHPILHSRIGPDQFVSRMARLREDPRFRAVQPDAFDTEGATDRHGPLAEQGMDEDGEEGLELWFDWAFVDFWKNHYCKCKWNLTSLADGLRYDSTVYRN